MPISKLMPRITKTTASLVTNGSNVSTTSNLPQVSDQSNASSVDLISASSHSKVSSCEITSTMVENQKIQSVSTSNDINHNKNVSGKNNQLKAAVLPFKCEKQDKLKLAAETTTKILSLNIDDSKKESTTLTALAILPDVKNASSNANTANEEIKDSHAVITKSVLMNQFVEEVSFDIADQSMRTCQKNLGLKIN